MNSSYPQPKFVCIRCGREVPAEEDCPAPSAEETLCNRCYEKMLFPETHLKNMEIFD
jgi:DNA-directed RNA polymerase subunit RPC12/RpoP